MSTPFVMPPVEVGQIVHWYPDGDRNQQPHAAIVTRVANRTVSLNTVVPSILNFLPREGVRHVNDPDARQVEFRENGAWDYTKQHREHLELLRAVAKLTASEKK